MSAAVASLDHLVFTVADIARTCEFYTHALGMKVVRFGEGRVALHFGQQKINLHQADRTFDPKAAALRRDRPISASCSAGRWRRP